MAETEAILCQPQGSSRLCIIPTISKGQSLVVLPLNENYDPFEMFKAHHIITVGFHGVSVRQTL